MAPGTCRTTCNSPLHPPGTSLLPLDAHRSDVTKGKRLVDTRETDGCWQGRRQASGALWKNGRPCALRKRDSTPPDDLVRLNVSNLPEFVWWGWAIPSATFVMWRCTSNSRHTSQPTKEDGRNHTRVHDGNDWTRSDVPLACPKGHISCFFKFPTPEV